MSLEKILCPKCQSEDVDKEEDSNILNLVIGAAIGAYIGNVTKQYYLSGIIGPACYFLDFPLGPEIEYSCKKCRHGWEDD